MEDGTPSVTAMVGEMMRAAHHLLDNPLLDNPPKIFEDTFALRLSGCESEAALRAQVDLIDTEFTLV